MLDYNKIDDVGVVAVALALTPYSNLQFLNLCDNHITEAVYIDITVPCVINKKIEVLQLSVVLIQ